jgi:hypothetical protein
LEIDERLLAILQQSFLSPVEIGDEQQPARPRLACERNRYYQRATPGHRHLVAAGGGDEIRYALRPAGRWNDQSTGADDCQQPSKAGKKWATGAEIRKYLRGVRAPSALLRCATSATIKNPQYFVAGF